MTSAWWVPFPQIRMKDGTGYDVIGKKNYLPPAMLVLGYGILWTTEDEETMERHARPLLTTTDDIPQEDETGRIDNVEEDGSESGDANELGEDREEDKYNLKQYGSASEDEEEQIKPSEPDFSEQTTTKRYLSAKQRRDLKKGNPVQIEESEESDVDDVTSSVDSISLKQKPVPKVRGKKGKMKKMKEKYADQSDEERELARKLLGAKSNIPEKQTKEEQTPTTVVEKQPPQPAKKIIPPSRPPLPKPIVEEPLVVSMKYAAKCTQVLDFSSKEFIAAPKPGDIISDAIAVCAPWSALTRYKYKVKLTPGSTKKGKAARSIIGVFLSMPMAEDDAEKMSPREKDLLISLKG